MKRTPRISMVNALIVCLVASQLSSTLFANEIRAEEASSSAAVNVSSELSAPELFGSDALSAPLFAAAGSTFTVKQAADTHAPLAASPRLWHGAFDAMPIDARTSFADGRGYRGRGYRGHHNAAAALALGAVAAITGTAILVYANRPECSTSRFAGGCGYGTKVVGGAVLAGGIVGFVIAAATW